MKTQLTWTLLLAAGVAFAAKPTPCATYPATVYVATSTSYALTGDSTPTDWFDGVPYVKYQDGQGGVTASVSEARCGGQFNLTFGSGKKSRILNVSFQNWLNNGASGPPSGGQPQSTTAGGLLLRGFTFTWHGIGPGDSYTTMMPVNGLGFGGVLRYEPMSSDYLADNPDFPTYPEFNVPCGTSAAKMTVINATETLVTAAPVTCGTYTGPVVTFQLSNVGQYGMDFRFRIVVPGLPRY